MLNGEMGEGVVAAISLLVDIGEFFEADKLIPISSTHISGVSYLTGGDGLLEQLRLFVKKGSKIRVHSTLNPCGMDRKQWKTQFISEDFATPQTEILQLFRKLDVPTTCSCTPYDHGHILRKGEHVAWAESSAVSFANTFFGARTNKEDSLSVLAAAITGLTPNYGFHLTENRVPNIEVRVDTEINEYTDYSILGEVVGKQFAGYEFPYGPIPLFRGIKDPRPQDIKSLGAALASFGTHLYHIEGITPEQELLKSLHFEDEEMIVTKDLLDEALEAVRPTEPINIAVIGCPNANLEEIIEVSKLVAGRKLKEGKHFWVFSSSAQRAIAESAGYIEPLYEAGVKFFVDTCPEVMPYSKSKFKRVLTNSMKAQHYISAPSLNDMPTFVMSLKECVEEMFE